MKIAKAIADLGKITFGPSLTTQLVYRKDSIELRLKTDGISLKERDWLKSELENINQTLFAAKLSH